MYRAVMLLACILLSGCLRIGIDAWDNSSSPTQGECPDTEYDNGGNVRPMPGICKMGTGALISATYRF